VFVVAGGGWGVYRHGQLHQPAKVNAAPAPQVAAPAAGGFSSAGAIRTPQTVKGPAADKEPKPKVEKNPSAVKPISKWDPNFGQGANKSTMSAKKQTAVKPIPLARDDNAGQGANSGGVTR
jgi:hypothetical protein